MVQEVTGRVKNRVISDRYRNQWKTSAIACGKATSRNPCFLIIRFAIISASRNVVGIFTHLIVELPALIASFAMEI